ncbi:carbohydrate ABC transporter permease [Evansella sp. AB-rgal1]|uniref:carbohydrate ABC transporter permease n=1 Tax=Evansella sp. AB-rgal1 TaxID=3242696 RepID=UPI00359ED54C
MYYKDPKYKIFYVFNIVFLLLLSILCLLPLVHIFAVSLSSQAPADANLVTFFPIGFTLESYEKTFSNPLFFTAFGISVSRTVVGTILGMLITMLVAYPLSKDPRDFRTRNVYVWFFLFVMIFNAGLVPTYVLIQNLGLIDSFWVLILPGLVNVFNIILMLNFFRNLPKELDEAAIMDGASDFSILFRIYVPISLPSIATLSLFTMVFHWNAWFDGMIFMNSQSNWPLQTLIQSIVVGQDFGNAGLSSEDIANLSDRTVKAAQIFIAMLPILAVYPFLQKFFVKGIVLGSVKE